MSHISRYLEHVKTIAATVDQEKVDQAVAILASLRQEESQGRLFILGVGGSAANASHAVNDFRKLAGIETYAPSDNVSELTARTNDEGWDTVFCEWLKVSRLSRNDVIMVLSVGGGNREKNISVNLVRALEYAAEKDARIVGIVGRDGGYTAQVADVCILIPTIEADLVTPLAEAWQGVVWHMMVSDPRLQLQANKWESVVPQSQPTAHPKA